MKIKTIAARKKRIFKAKDKAFHLFRYLLAVPKIINQLPEPVFQISGPSKVSQYLPGRKRLQHHMLR